VFHESTARELEIEEERVAMREAMNDIAELINYEHIDKSEIAKLIFPFVNENHMSYIAVLAFSE
jgi:hypothetical protein